MYRIIPMALDIANFICGGGFCVGFITHWAEVCVFGLGHRLEADFHTRLRVGNQNCVAPLCQPCALVKVLRTRQPRFSGEEY